MLLLKSALPPISLPIDCPGLGLMLYQSFPHLLNSYIITNHMLLISTLVQNSSKRPDTVSLHFVECQIFVVFHPFLPLPLTHAFFKFNVFLIPFMPGVNCAKWLDGTHWQEQNPQKIPWKRDLLPSALPVGPTWQLVGREIRCRLEAGSCQPS